MFSGFDLTTGGTDGSCCTLRLRFDPEVVPGQDFRRRILQELERFPDRYSYESAESLQGLAEEIGDLFQGYRLMHTAPGDHTETGLLLAACASVLADRFGGSGSPLEARQEPGHEVVLRFSPVIDFLHAYSMLYSIDLFHSIWNQNKADQRLVQLLEVGHLFFLNEYSLGDGEDNLFNGLGGHFPQEVLNSFVNLIHPHPEHAENLLRKILLLEDNRELAEIVSDMLSSFGYVVCVAYDGLEGLDRIECESFDLVVSDIQMPKLDGIGFMRVLKNLKPEIPVILTTGYTGIWEEEYVLRNGAVAFLPKPFRMENLISAVNQVLRLRKETPQAKTT